MGENGLGFEGAHANGGRSADGDRHHARRLQRVSDLVEIAGQMKASSVIVAGGDRIEDLKLVESARDHGIVDRIILVGKKPLIEKTLKHLKIDIESGDLVSADSDEEVASHTVDLIEGGGVDIVLKGNISTPVLNRHMLKIAVKSTVSLVTIFDAAPIMDGKPVILTDAGFTTVCNFGRMVDLVNNAVEVARLVMGIPKPRVAILSANEKQIPSLPSTWIGAKLAQRQWPDAVVYGPLSFDLATDPESVAIKGLPDAPHAGEVAGRADVLVAPGIDAANAIYKAVTAMVKYGQASSAGITLGFSVPYIIISRADPLSVRLESIALCSIYSQQKAKEGDRKGTENGEASGKGPVSSGDSEDPDSLIRALAVKAAVSVGRPLEDVVLVVARLGERPEVAAVDRGKVIDRVAVEWPGGESLFEESALRVSKGIGAMFAATECDVEAIVIGWGASGAGDKAPIVKGIRSRVGRLAPVLVFD